MPKITFPWHVNVNGAYYKPGEEISVEDAAEYVKQGATVVSRPTEEDKPDAYETPARRGRRSRV